VEISETRHPNEGALVKFLERSDQSAAYVRETAEWIKKNYPGSVRTLLPKLRAIYKAKPKT
jgi:hypothetical protein